MSEGKREGLVRAVPPEQQARELGAACLPPWAPLHQDDASFSKKMIDRQCFVGDGCLVGTAGLRHDQHLLLPCCYCVRVRGARFFSCIFVSPLGAKSSATFFQKTPQYHGKRPGVFFFTCKIAAYRGAFTPNIVIL